MWYPCQNQSGTANYELCRAHYPVEPGIRPHIRDIALAGVTGVGGVWRAGWLNCLPESPCRNVTVAGVAAPGALGWRCEHVRGGEIAQSLGAERSGATSVRTWEEPRGHDDIAPARLSRAWVS